MSNKIIIIFLSIATIVLGVGIYKKYSGPGETKTIDVGTFTILSYVDNKAALNVFPCTKNGFIMSNEYNPPNGCFIDVGDDYSAIKGYRCNRIKIIQKITSSLFEEERENTIECVGIEKTNSVVK